MESLYSDLLTLIFDSIKDAKQSKKMNETLVKHIQLSFVKAVSKKFHQAVTAYINEHLSEKFSSAQQIEILKHLARNGYLSCLKETQDSFNYRPDPAYLDIICAKAAISGNVDIVRYFVDQGCNLIGRVTECAFKSGSLELAKYIHDKRGAELIPILNQPYGVTAQPLVKYGQIPVIEYLMANGFVPNARLASHAAKLGRLDVLKFLHEHNCPWSAKTCESAAQGGSVECLRYAHEHGCEWGETVVNKAAAAGHLSVLQYAVEHDCPIGLETCAEAAAGGSIACVEYLRQHGAPWGPELAQELTCYRAAERGQLEVLKYVRAQGAPWGEGVCMLATRRGFVNIVKYAHENNCPCEHRQ